MRATAHHSAVLLAGTGNRFVLLDGHLGGQHPWDPAALPALLARAEARGFRPDGVLSLEAAQQGGDVRLVIYNRDGTRPAACGNGTRCVGHYAATTFGRTRTRLRVETDAGLRELQLERPAPGQLDVRVNMGTASVKARDVELPNGLRATLVDMGNPHCVVLVDDLARVAGMPGPALEREARIIQSALGSEHNIEFVQRDESGLRAVIYERGVGETESCGTGACAAASVAHELLGLSWPLDVTSRGGCLTVARGAAGCLWLSGPVELAGHIELDAPS